MWYDDDEHPLAGEYRLAAYLTLDEIWFYTHHRDLAIYLMRGSRIWRFPKRSRRHDPRVFNHGWTRMNTDGFAAKERKRRNNLNHETVSSRVFGRGTGGRMPPSLAAKMAAATFSGSL